MTQGVHRNKQSYMNNKLLKLGTEYRQARDRPVGYFRNKLAWPRSRTRVLVLALNGLYNLLQLTNNPRTKERAVMCDHCQLTNGQ